MEKGLLGIIAWITGVLVSLAVGFGMIDGSLVVPYIGIVNQIAGWVVVIGAVISVVMAIFHK